MPPIAPLVQLAARQLESGPVISLPLQDTSFTLDSSGVAGFFGGDGAVQGMATVHLFEGRRWFGCYNTPGSYEIAKQYGQLAKARLWDGLFPGPNRDPAQLFGLDGKSGPRFLAAHSGSVIQRSAHPAYLVARKAQSIPPGQRTRIPCTRRSTFDCNVTTVDLSYAPPSEEQPRRLKSNLPLLALIPIVTSIGTCVLCALVADWWCFASIASGILASGVACFVIGSGQLTFTHPQPATGAPPGDGVLLDDEGIIVLRGCEDAVNSVTRGRFCLKFASEPKYNGIGVCSVGLTAQFLVQLLLIPQGTLFGQVMFVVTLGVSWMYNAYLSALEKEDIQTDILVDLLHLSETKDIQKFALGTRTAQVVFTALLLQPREPVKSPRPLKPYSPRKLLDELLPNDTPVWDRWKEAIVEKLRTGQSLTFGGADSKVPGFTLEDQELLSGLFRDAEEAYRGWQRACCDLYPDSICEEK
ncbi:hypothetical protein TRAPUB_8433 [Trametes pubescens]|uniref:Uncharacterized protein n=1 Tax=Trametes pubescens TaxID=154538 RepID=A0A1M2W5F6_TRAPU|nr:hypothetical protein TRAPUB_8433 [Trametes pubescens]